MCIRDMLLAGANARGIPVYKHLGGIRAITPVSYTHLDVYKRQTQDIRQGEMVRENNMKGLRGRGDLEEK